MSVEQSDKNSDYWCRIIASAIPILNNRDSNGNIIQLGPINPRIRYLVVIFAAKFCTAFRLWGKEMDSSVYFTIYQLGKVADSFKQFEPHHQPIRYDRTKVAIRIYTMLSEKGLVITKRREFVTYVAITQKGEDLLKELFDGYKFW
jgi:hypothetical protein